VRWPHMFYYRSNPSDAITGTGAGASSAGGSSGLKGKGHGIGAGTSKPRGAICLTDAKVEVVRGALEFHIISASFDANGTGIGSSNSAHSSSRRKWSMQAASVADLESWLAVVSGRFQHT
jgi:hypothetical protein